MRSSNESALAPLSSRTARLERLRWEVLDVLVVGGGITGAGIALDLSLRGLKVVLVERGDWAGATSSASSRLVHGGLRYLEQYEFGLVRESCLERALLLRNAAGMVWPERFTFPVRAGDRVGRWKLAAGLGLYTLVSVPRVLGIPRLLSAADVHARIPGIDEDGLRGGGSYLDGATDDARLTLSVVTSAIGADAIALSRTELEHLDSGSDGVEASLRDLLGGETFIVRARRAVLAGGPFTEGLRERAGLRGRWVSPTRGAHVLVPRRRLPTDGAVIFPSRIDGRVMFLIPWPRYTVIGTTDLDASPDDEVRATRAEVDYLLASANSLVPAAGLTTDDVVSTWAGLRPLIAADEDPSARSREERLVREGPVYTIAGGKLTGYRSMAEKLGAQLTSDLDTGRGGSSSPTRHFRLRGALPNKVPRPRWSTPGKAGKSTPLEIAHRMRYAALAPAATARIASVEDGERALDPETLLGEVDWAVRHEDALTAVDFFLRRTNLGFGPDAEVDAAREPVLDRMTQLLAWTPAERAREADRLDAALARGRRWRDDPTS